MITRVCVSKQHQTFVVFFQQVRCWYSCHRRVNFEKYFQPTCRLQLSTLVAPGATGDGARQVPAPKVTWWPWLEVPHSAHWMLLGLEFVVIPIWVKAALCEAFQLLSGTQELSNQIERAPQIKQSGQILSNSPKISFILESYPQRANTSMGVEVMSRR